MPAQLSQDLQTEMLYLLTLTCHRRHPYLADAPVKHRVLRFLEETRQRYGFRVEGYVAMPEHMHALVSGPRRGSLERVTQTFKATVTRNATEHPFWQPRFENIAVHTEEERLKTLRLLHWNPVRRGLVAKPEQWPWSSFRSYLLRTPGVVRIDALELTAHPDQAAQPEKCLPFKPGSKAWIQGITDLRRIHGSYRDPA